MALSKIIMNYDLDKTKMFDLAMQQGTPCDDIALNCALMTGNDHIIKQVLAKSPKINEDTFLCAMLSLKREWLEAVVNLGGLPDINSAIVAFRLSFATSFVAKVNFVLDPTTIKDQFSKVLIYAKEKYGSPVNLWQLYSKSQIQENIRNKMLAKADWIRQKYSVFNDLRLNERIPELIIQEAVERKSEPRKYLLTHEQYHNQALEVLGRKLLVMIIFIRNSETNEMYVLKETVFNDCGEAAVHVAKHILSRVKASTMESSTPIHIICDLHIKHLSDVIVNGFKEICFKKIPSNEQIRQYLQVLFCQHHCKISLEDFMAALAKTIAEFSSSHENLPNIYSRCAVSEQPAMHYQMVSLFNKINKQLKQSSLDCDFHDSEGIKYR